MATATIVSPSFAVKKCCRSVIEPDLMTRFSQNDRQRDRFDLKALQQLGS